MDKLDKSLDEIMASEHRRPAKPKPKPKPAGSGGAPKPGPSSSLASRIGPKVKVNAAGASKAVASAIKSNSEGQAKGGGKAPSAKKGKARAEPYSVTSRGTFGSTGPKVPITARLGPTNGAPVLKKTPSAAGGPADLKVTITNDMPTRGGAPGVFQSAISAIATPGGLSVRGRGNVAHVPWDPTMRRMMGGMVADAVEARMSGKQLPVPKPAAPKRRVDDDMDMDEPAPVSKKPVAIAGTAVPRPGATTVKVSNLHAEASEQDLKAALSEYGKVIRVGLLYNSNGVSTGEAHVVFEARPDALKCIRALDGQLADGKTLRCEEVKTLTIAGASKVEKPAGPSGGGGGAGIRPSPTPKKGGITSRLNDTRPQQQQQVKFRG